MRVSRSPCRQVRGLALSTALPGSSAHAFQTASPPGRPTWASPRMALPTQL